MKKEEKNRRQTIETYFKIVTTDILGNHERMLKSFDIQRDYKMYADDELYNYGKDLFNNGFIFDLEDANVALYYATCSEDLFNFLNWEWPFDEEKFMDLKNNPKKLFNIQNGWNVANRVRNAEYINNGVKNNRR